MAEADEALDKTSEQVEPEAPETAEAAPEEAPETVPEVVEETPSVPAAAAATGEQDKRFRYADGKPNGLRWQFAWKFSAMFYGAVAGLAILFLMQQKGKALLTQAALVQAGLLGAVAALALVNIVSFAIVMLTNAKLQQEASA